MKIISTGKRATVTDEIELPIYRKHDCGGDDYDSMRYMRISEGENGKLIAVTIHQSHSWNSGERGYEVTVDRNYRFDSRSEADYNLGRGEYALSVEGWNQAVEAFGSFIATHLGDAVRWGKE